jgi:chemotaxis protein histidine kinase CheA
MKKIQPLLDGLGKLFNGVFRAVEPLFNTLVDLAIGALPTVSKAFGVVYSSVTAVFQSLGMLGGAIKKLISGDFSGAWQDAKSSVNDFSSNYDKSVKRFNDGTKEMSKTEKEEAEKRAEARKAAQEKQAANDEKAKQERIRKAEEEKKRLEEIEKERQAFISSQGERARDEYEAAQKLIADTKKANEDALKTENQIKVEKENADFELKKQSLIEKGLSIEEIEKEHKRNLTNLDTEYFASEADKAIKRDADEKASSEARRKLIELEKKEKLDAADAVANTLSAMSELLGKETAAGKAAAVASATINTFSSAQKAYDATVGIPYVGPILAPINAGIAIAAGIKNVKSILAVKVPGGGGGSAPSGGGGGASTPAAPAFNVVGASPTNQLAQTIGNQQQQPIKAYVVSNDVTTAQSLDRNIISSASIG